MTYFSRAFMSLVVRIIFPLNVTASMGEDPNEESLLGLKVLPFDLSRRHFPT